MSVQPKKLGKFRKYTGIVFRPFEPSCKADLKGLMNCSVNDLDSNGNFYVAVPHDCNFCEAVE
jgi:hypothetical protein